ncbi:hypothetical protein GCM10009574_083690 [Streptomyces asiaticus]
MAYQTTPIPPCPSSLASLYRPATSGCAPWASVPVKTALLFGIASHARSSALQDLPCGANRWVEGMTYALRDARMEDRQK